MPANWTELRDNWNIWAKRQELDSAPALIPDWGQPFNFAHEGPVDSSTPCKGSATGAQHRMSPKSIRFSFKPFWREEKML